ncbi:peptide deformylase [Acidobacteriota bacterium]
MAVLKVLKFGNPILEKKAKSVDLPDDSLEEKVRDMVETMYAAPGVGLAANQVGWDMQLAVIDLTVGEEPDNLLVLINPEVIETKGSEACEEGCLSIPGFAEMVKRPAYVKIRAVDLDGEPYEIEGEELLARALMHEIDHLNGVLFLEHLSRLKRDLIKRKIRKLAKTGEWD